MTDGVAAGRCERMWCAIGLFILGADGAACGLGSVFGGVVKFEGVTSAGVESTLVDGATLRGVNTLGGGVSLGGDGGGTEGLAVVGVIVVLVSQMLNRSQSLEMANSCSW